MKLTLQQTTLAIAIATVSGATLAADEIRSVVDDNLGNSYSQTIGTSNYQSNANGYKNTASLETANNDKVKSATTKVAGKKIEDAGVSYQQYSYTETRDGELQNTTNSLDTTLTDANTQTFRVEIVESSENLSGTVTRTANTQVELNSIGAEINGTEQRTADTSFKFDADDLAKVNNAIKQSSYLKQVYTAYTDADVRDSSIQDEEKLSDLKSEYTRDANGKETKELHSVGTVSSENTSNTTYYKSETKDGKVASKQTDGKLSETASNSKSEIVATDYVTNTAGEVAGFVLSADKKSLEESTVNTTKVASTSEIVDYDDVVALNYTSKGSSSNSTVEKSILDGFEYVDETSSEYDYKIYNQGKHALNFDNSSKSSSKETSREFVKNADGEIVLTNDKPTVASETTTTKASESASATYQDSIITAAGENKDKAYKDVIVNTALTPDAHPWRDDNTAKSVENSETSTVTTRKSDGFQEHWNTKSVDTANYARNLQENIEVNRDLVDSNLTDNKYLSSITGVTVTKAAEAGDFKLGTVAVDVNGKEFTVADVNSWKDETGKDRYYVVIDQDADGKDIRSEVTFKDGKPLETTAAKVETVITQNTLDQRSDQVTMGEEVAYHTNEKSQNNNTETSLDGNTVYSVDNSATETDTKVYSIGKNELHHEQVYTENGEYLDTTFETLGSSTVFENGQPVITGTESGKWTASETSRIFQEGQAKTGESTNTLSYEGKRTDATGNVTVSLKGHDNDTSVTYAKGQELASTNVRDAASEITAKAVTQNVGYDYSGTAKANIVSNTLRQDGTVDAGLAVSAAKAGNIVVDTQVNLTALADEKVYQDGGAKALESTTANTDVTTITYADNTTGTIKNNDSSSVTLYNKGQADKYREAVNTTESELTAKTYQYDEDGDVVLDASGAPVEVGTSSDKSTIKTAENYYQIGQERKTDKVVTTIGSEDKTNLDGSASNLVAESTVTDIEYRAGQVDGKATESTSAVSSTLKVTNTDQTGFTYDVNASSNDVAFDTEDYLLATQEVKSSTKSEWTETLAADGKDTVSITRGSATENRTDSSDTTTTYGSETVTAAAGTKTVVSKKETDVTDKFGTFESNTLNRTEATVAADGTSTAKSETRVDNVQGITLTEDKVVTDKDGKATTTAVASTSIKAGEIKVGDVTLSADSGLNAGNKVVSNVANGVAATDAVNVQQLQAANATTLTSANAYTDTQVSRVSKKLDDVEKTSYRGIAIALAAQQQVPNIKPGQFAVFGGVGHYEGESAGALGVVGALADGRTSVSAALGVAGSGEVGGRVGVAYVFGGN